MRRLSLCLMVIVWCFPLHAQRTRYGQELPFPKKGVDYSMEMSITGIHVRPNCVDSLGYCTRDVILDTLSQAGKQEFSCSSGLPAKAKDPLPVALGTTHARILPTGSGNAIGDDFEILTSNGRVMKCWLSGIFDAKR